MPKHANFITMISAVKGVYLYEYMHYWEKFNETLPEKDDFYSRLNLQDIIDVDFAHTKRVCKDFKIKHLGEYHNLMFKKIHYCSLMYLTTSAVCVSKVASRWF